MVNDKDFLTIELEDGEVLEREILFTYEDEKTKKNYVFIIEPSEVEDEEDDVIVLRYDNEELFDVEDDKELEQLQKVLDAFFLEEEELLEDENN